MSACKIGAYQNETGSCFLLPVSPWPPFTWGVSVPLLLFILAAARERQSCCRPQRGDTGAQGLARRLHSTFIAFGGGAGLSKFLPVSSSKQQQVKC